MDTDTVYFVIGIVGCIIGIISFYFSRRDSYSKNAKDGGVLQNELSHISNDVKDIKAEFRIFRNDIVEAKTLAIEAKASADLAHTRLDSLFKIDKPES